MISETPNGKIAEQTRLIACDWNSLSAEECMYAIEMVSSAPNVESAKLISELARNERIIDSGYYLTIMTALCNEMKARQEEATNNFETARLEQITSSGIGDFTIKESAVKNTDMRLVRTNKSEE